MTFVRRAVLVACVIFAGCMVGVLLQHLTPDYAYCRREGRDHHHSRLGDLAARLGAGAPHLDELRSLFTAAVRGSDAARERFWAGDGAGPARLTYAQSRAELRDLDAFFAALKPATDEQRRLLDTIRQLSASIVQTYYLMARQLRSPFPKPLLISVVCWATLLFTCVGALSTFNALAVTYEALGAGSAASAIYLILEFSEPYLGLFRILHEGPDQVIAALSANGPRSD